MRELVLIDSVENARIVMSYPVSAYTIKRLHHGLTIQSQVIDMTGFQGNMSRKDIDMLLDEIDTIVENNKEYLMTHPPATEEDMQEIIHALGGDEPITLDTIDSTSEVFVTISVLKSGYEAYLTMKAEKHEDCTKETVLFEEVLRVVEKYKQKMLYLMPQQLREDFLVSLEKTEQTLH